MLFASEHVRRCDTRLIFGVLPAFQTHTLMKKRMLEKADITGGEDGGIARAQRRIDDDAVIDRETARLREFNTRRNADAHDREIAVDDLAIAQHDAANMPLADQPFDADIETHIDAHRAMHVHNQL